MNTFEKDETITITGNCGKLLYHRVRELVERTRYKPNGGWRVTRSNRGLVFVQHQQDLEDCIEEEAGPSLQRGRKFLMSEHMTDEEILRTLLLSAKLFEEHEAHEWFRVDGRRFLNPHPEGGRGGS